VHFLPATQSASVVHTWLVAHEVAQAAPYFPSRQQTEPAGQSINPEQVIGGASHVAAQAAPVNCVSRLLDGQQTGGAASLTALPLQSSGPLQVILTLPTPGQSFTQLSVSVVLLKQQTLPAATSQGAPAHHTLPVIGIGAQRPTDL
jgi:hypothetical protein